jgi:hypothetical protein
MSCLSNAIKEVASVRTKMSKEKLGIYLLTSSSKYFFFFQSNNIHTLNPTVSSHSSPNHEDLLQIYSSITRIPHSHNLSPTYS